ncbi:MAG: hypothetical protein IPG71_12675 [bacterium]|nr:hypothetical protein [bacterium]
MKRCVAMFLLVLLYASHACFAAGQQLRAPVQWTQISRSEWQIDFLLPGLRLDTMNIAGSDWVDVNVPGLSKLAVAGEPALPLFTAVCPAAVNLSNFEVVDETTHRMLAAPPLPAPQPLDRAFLANLTYLPDPQTYAQATPFPANRIDIIHSGKFGGQDFALLVIHPLTYDFLNSIYSVTERLTLRLTLPQGVTLDQTEPRNSRDFRFWQELSIIRPASPPDEIVEPRMWIVTEPEFDEALAEWRTFKSECGIPSELIHYSSVASDAASLRDYLQTRYAASTNPAEFILLVGDAAQIPGFYGIASSLTDHPYSLLSGSDYLPDIALGRIPCTTVTELSQWLIRAVAYERDGYALSSTAACFSSSVALDPQHGQHVSTLFATAGLMTTHLQQPQTGALPLLVNAINAEPLWTFYIGHGSASAWSSVAPHFTTSGLDLVGLAHPGMVVSVPCATADVDEPEASIAEQWTFDLLSGGALCYVGATESTAFFYSDTIGLGILEAVFTENFTYLGEALDYGKLRCAQSFPQPSGGLTEETIQQFVLLGDPSLRPYTTAPTQLTIDLPQVLPVGTTHVPVNVLANGSALANVEVVLSSDSSAPRLVRTDVAGFALLPLPITSAHLWTVTALARNYIPARRTVTVAPLAGPQVQLVEIEFEEAVGDLDGVLDRGESGTARILVRNSGTTTSPAGMIRIATTGTALSFGSIMLPIGELPAQSEDWLGSSTTFSVSRAATDNHVARVQCWHEYAEESVFAGLWSVTLRAPAIEFVSSLIVEAQGDGDGNPEAGEQLELQVVVTNRGGESLREVIADCAPSFEYMLIQDTRWTRDSLSAVSQDTIRYLFNADEATPRGYAFEYTIALTGMRSDTTRYWGRHRIGQVPVLLYVLDSQPQQIPGITAALDVLGIEHESVTQLPLDLSRYSSVWIFSGVHPNQESISNQAAQRIASYLDDGGSCYWEGADVWAFDNPTVLQPYFNIEGIADGAGDAGPISGVRGQFTNGMSFSYGGENSFIDRLSADGAAFDLLRNTRDGATYSLCVANQGAGYRTIGSSIEIGALNDQDAPSTRVLLVREFLNWFGIPVIHDVNPPVITHVPPAVWHSEQWPIPLFADVQDDSEIDIVACDFRVNGGALQSAPLQHSTDGYTAELPAQPLEPESPTGFAQLTAPSRKTLYSPLSTNSTCCASTAMFCVSCLRQSPLLLCVNEGRSGKYRFAGKWTMKRFWCS